MALSLPGCFARIMYGFSVLYEIVQKSLPLQQALCLVLRKQHIGLGDRGILQEAHRTQHLLLAC